MIQTYGDRYSLLEPASFSQRLNRWDGPIVPDINHGCSRISGTIINTIYPFLQQDTQKSMSRAGDI